MSKESEIMSRKRGSVHSNTGPKSREQMQKTERRFKARRQHDITEARLIGLHGDEFERLAAEYLRGGV